MPRNTSRANGAKRPGTKSLKRAKVKRGEASDNPAKLPGQPIEAEVIKLIGLLHIIEREMEIAAGYAIDGEYQTLENCSAKLRAIVKDLADAFLSAPLRDTMNFSHPLAMALDKKNVPLMDQKLNEAARQLIAESEAKP